MWEWINNFITHFKWIQLSIHMIIKGPQIDFLPPDRCLYMRAVENSTWLILPVALCWLDQSHIKRHVSVLNGAFRDMGQVHHGIFEFVQFPSRPIPPVRPIMKTPLPENTVSFTGPLSEESTHTGRFSSRSNAEVWYSICCWPGQSVKQTV